MGSGCRRSALERTRRDISLLEVDDVAQKQGGGGGGRGAGGKKIGARVVWVSHKPIDFFPMFPYKGALTQALPGPDRVIGRSMTEGDRLSFNEVQQLKKGLIDELWVPAPFMIDVLHRSGVSLTELPVYVIPEGIDTVLYDPSRYDAQFLRRTDAEFRKGNVVEPSEEYNYNENPSLGLQQHYFDFLPISNGKIAKGGNFSLQRTSASSQRIPLCASHSRPTSTEFQSPWPAIKNSFGRKLSRSRSTWGSVIARHCRVFALKLRNGVPRKCLCCICSTTRSYYQVEEKVGAFRCWRR